MLRKREWGISWGSCRVVVSQANPNWPTSSQHWRVTDNMVMSPKVPLSCLSWVLSISWASVDSGVYTLILQKEDFCCFCYWFSEHCKGPLQPLYGDLCKELPSLQLSPFPLLRSKFSQGAESWDCFHLIFLHITFFFFYHFGTALYWCVSFSPCPEHAACVG